MAKAITASTQEHLPVEDIVEDIVILKDGSAALVLQTTAVNFGLLSEKEQDATIFAYGALLNSLSHPIQILIRSKRTDISSYLEQLEDSFAKQTNPALKSQIGKYIEFVKTTVQKGKVLDKKFYIIIPFSFLEMGAAKAVAGFAKRKKKASVYPKEYIIEQAKINLYPKKDQLLKQLTRLGLKGQVLTQPELVELFFDIYNPAAVGAQKITAEAGTYTGPIVEPAIAAPPQAAEGPAANEESRSAPLEGPEQMNQPEQPTMSTTKSPPPTPTVAQQAETQQVKTTPASQAQAGSSEKVLKELQDLIEKAKSVSSPDQIPKTTEKPASSEQLQAVGSELLKQKVETKTAVENRPEKKPAPSWGSSDKGGN